MQTPDVNILIYAFREAAPDHLRYRRWLEELVNGSQAYALSDLVLSGFLRIVTNPRVFPVPSGLDKSLAFAAYLKAGVGYVSLQPGPRHWKIFTDLCASVGVRGNLVPDAYFAALAIESGCEWITRDTHFSRFPGLRWRHPLG